MNIHNTFIISYRSLTNGYKCYETIYKTKEEAEIALAQPGMKSAFGYDYKVVSIYQWIQDFMTSVIYEN